MYEIDWNKVLKMPVNSEVDFQYLYKFNNGCLPVPYSQLYQIGKLSLKEFTLIKRLWNCDKCRTNVSVNTLINWFFDSQDSKQNRNSLAFSLRKLEKYGLIHWYKEDFKSYTLSLSSVIFVKIKQYLSRFLTNVGWFYSMYLKTDGKMMVRDIERVPIIGIRESITGLRVPILTNSGDSNKRKLNFNAKKYEGLSESEKIQLERLSAFGQSYVDNKLKQIRRNSMSRLTEDERECIDEFVPYYENLICSITGRVEYTLLDNIRNKKMSKLWKPIWKTFSLCKEKGFDWKIYLDAQFDSFKNWNQSNLRFPMPNMLYSERALVAYDNYIYHNETAYRNEGWSKTLKAKDTGKYADEIKKKLETDVSQIKVKIQYNYMKRNNNIFKSIDRNLPDIDSLYWSKAIQDMWAELSVEFLAMVPNSRADLSTMRGRFESWDAKLDCFDEVTGNRAKMEAITDVWNELDIPKLYGLTEVNSKIKSASTT